MWVFVGGFYSSPAVVKCVGMDVLVRGTDFQLLSYRSEKPTADQRQPEVWFS